MWGEIMFPDLCASEKKLSHKLTAKKFFSFSNFILFFFAILCDYILK